MAGGYIVLALTLNVANRWVRAAGTGLAALGLVMIALADVDGTFAAYRSACRAHADDLQRAGSPRPPHRRRPRDRRVAADAPPRRGAARLANSAKRFGWVSRLAQRTTAVLILCLVPIGLFVAVLPADSTDRAGFLAAHQALGPLVIPLAALHLGAVLKHHRLDRRVEDIRRMVR